MSTSIDAGIGSSSVSVLPAKITQMSSWPVLPRFRSVAKGEIDHGAYKLDRDVTCLLTVVGVFAEPQCLHCNGQHFHQS